jgi:hypothetical protein
MDVELVSQNKELMVSLHYSDGVRLLGFGLGSLVDAVVVGVEAFHLG